MKKGSKRNLYRSLLGLQFGTKRVYERVERVATRSPSHSEGRREGGERVERVDIVRACSLSEQCSCFGS